MTEPSGSAQQDAAAPPKRDKFASMAATAATSVPPKRDKLASMAAASSQASSADADDTTNKSEQSKEEYQALVKKRMTQRDQVLKDLEKAEGWTWQLLSLASKTARSLSELDMDNVEELGQTSQQYRTTLQKIHGTLSPHASLVVAYENHGIDKKQDSVVGADKKQDDAAKSQEEKKQEEASNEKKQDINMYAARVEMRLAHERRDVLKELLRLEQQESESAVASTTEEESAPAAGNKRKRRT